MDIRVFFISISEEMILNRLVEFIKYCALPTKYLGLLQ